MSANKVPFRRRQMRTMMLLIFILLMCIGANIYLYNRPAQPVTVTPSSSSDIRGDVSGALERFGAHTPQQLSEVVTHSADDLGSKIRLVFSGLADYATMEKIYDSLRSYSIDACFYITGIAASGNEKTVNAALDAGFSIGNAGYGSTQNMQNLSAEAIATDFCQASRAIALASGIQPSTMLLENTVYDEKVRAMAYACYIQELIEPDAYVDAARFASEEETRKYISDMPRGSIVCVKLSGTGTAQQQAERAKRLPDAVEWLARGAYSSDYDVHASQLLESEKGDMADIEVRVYTTEKAAAYTFSRLGSEGELMYLLDKLDAMNARCVFFLTMEEMENHSGSVDEIIRRGHDLGVSVTATGASSVASLVSDILKAQEALRNSFSYTGQTLVMQAAGYPGENLRKAVSACGLRLFTALTTATRDADARATDPQGVLAAVFPEINGYLQRGQIVHFKLGTYAKSDTMTGDLAQLINERRNIYALKSVNDMLSNTEEIYAYPLPESKVLSSVKDKIHPGQLQTSPLRAIQDRYIGVSWISTASTLPGFTSAEIKTLDRKGFIKNNNNAVFLTFDDWGTDKVVNDILNVLALYDARATFFVRTENVVYNPNLLRAIAKAGHSIGSHTHTHMSLANLTDEKKAVYSSLTKEQTDALAKDITESYELMQSIIGDISVDGKPALTRLFRPPTLAVSKEGLTTVFDCGYTYSISGNFSSGDYKAESAEKLAKDLKSNLKSGSVIVMHMSDTSKYTADALDILFTQLDLKKGNEYTFARLGDYLE